MNPGCPRGPSQTRHSGLCSFFTENTHARHRKHTVKSHTTRLRGADYSSSVNHCIAYLWGIMKKITAGLTFAAVAGLAALSATPAMAVPAAYPNCPAAAADGVYNIPVGAPGYGAHLDSDSDGIGCEKSGVPYTGAPVVQATATQAPVAPAAGTKQIVRVPVGGADTGVATKSTDNTGALALGGGLVLAAAAAGTFVVRRRNA